jgi:aspartyl-tRNA(Asn)/glutamyl-tRNA(Gln) amidotransferase subunit B
MRSKEEAHDYRYFPEPDLPPLVLDAARVKAIKDSMPELPAARRQRLVNAWALPMKDAIQLAGGKGEYFDAMVAEGAPPKPSANLVMSVVSSTMNELKTDDVSRIIASVPAKQAARLVMLIEGGKISFSIAKDVWSKAFDTRKPVDEIIEAEGLTQIDDESQILTLVDEVVRKNADAVAKYRAGSTGTFGFLVGQVMKSAGGKANPKRVNELLKRALDA